MSPRTHVDLHLHTSLSDGDDAPGELAERCHRAGVRVAACTDHDTLAGAAAFGAAARRLGITPVPGCEITALWHGREVHCLAYFVDPGDAVLPGRLALVRGAELDWWRAWFRRAGAIGAPVTWADVEAKVGTDRVPYIGDLLDLFLVAVDGDPRFAGYPRGGRHDRFIGDWCRAGRALHVPKPWRPQLAEVAGWICDAGGVAVLAHPARSLGDEPWRLDELRGAGLAGVEVWSTWHDPAQIRRLAEECCRLGLIGTQGSDYHGARLKPWVPRPGVVPEGAPDPTAIVDELAARR